MVGNPKITPNLFIVGFQKCGSSSLAALLDKHEQIVQSTPKETFRLADVTDSHYNQATSIFNEDIGWNSFYPQATNAEKYYLEGSVCNFYQETALDYIKGIDGAKVIFVLRDPVQRFVSTFKYYGRAGLFLKPGTTIEEYYRLIQSGVYANDGMRHAIEHGKYVQFIDCWTTQMKPELIFITSLKKLTTDESEAVRLFRFLELDNNIPLVLPHENKSVAIRFPKLTFFLRKHFKWGMPKVPLFRKIYIAINLGEEQVRPSEELVSTLKSIYREEYSRYPDFF